MINRLCQDSSIQYSALYEGGVLKSILQCSILEFLGLPSTDLLCENVANMPLLRIKYLHAPSQQPQENGALCLLIFNVAYDNGCFKLSMAHPFI